MLLSPTPRIAAANAPSRGQEYPVESFRGSFAGVEAKRQAVAYGQCNAICHFCAFCLSFHPQASLGGDNFMQNDRMMQAIGRMEHALARLEQWSKTMSPAVATDTDLQARHEQLKQETKAALAGIDNLIHRMGG